MPPNRFESEVESFLEGSHGDRTHIKRADHPRLHHYAGRYSVAKWHEKSTPEGVLGRNAEPPPVDRTEGGRCAPGGTRTPNLLNRNQMLYPLSYGRLPFGWI